MVPVLAGVIVAVAMESNRLTTSVQLLPALLGDRSERAGIYSDAPQRGGTPPRSGSAGLLVAQLAILLAGVLAGAVVLAEQVPRAERRQVAGGLSLLAGASVVALASH
jgi:hypothetical protein